MKKYIFEFIVIFVGITVSLIVDEWRQSVKQDQKTEEYYQQFSDDINMFEKKLDSINHALQIERHHMKGVLEKTYTSDSLPIMATFPQYFKPKGELNSNTFKTLISTGDRGLITNREIFLQLDIIEENHNILMDCINRSELIYTERLQPIINKHSIMTEFKRSYIDRKQPDLRKFEKLINDNEYTELLSELYLLNDLSIAIVGLTQSATNQLRQKVSMEINR